VSISFRSSCRAALEHVALVARDVALVALSQLLFEAHQLRLEIAYLVRDRGVDFALAALLAALCLLGCDPLQLERVEARACGVALGPRALDRIQGVGVRAHTVPSSISFAWTAIITGFW